MFLSLLALPPDSYPEAPSLIFSRSELIFDPILFLYCFWVFHHFKVKLCRLFVIYNNNNPLATIL